MVKVTESLRADFSDLLSIKLSRVVGTILEILPTFIANSLNYVIRERLRIT